MSAKNEFTHYQTDNPPFDLMNEMLRKANESERDGILLFITNGVTDPNGLNHDVKSMVVFRNPDAVALALFNQAISTGNIQHVEEMCAHLRRIADVTMENIRIASEIRRKQN